MTVITDTNILLSACLDEESESAGRNIDIFNKLLNQCCDNGMVISVADIATEHFILAEQLTKNVDINDKAFVAFFIAFEALVWTGDLK